MKALETIWDHVEVTSSKNVEVYPGVDGVINLSGIWPPSVPAFQDLVKAFANSSSAAPYDWRLMPQQKQFDLWVKETKESIQTLSETAGSKVHLVAHSMGNLMLQYMFSQGDEQFFSQYVAGYIAVSPPFGGAPEAVQAIIFGIQYKNVTVPASFIQGFPAVPWLYPRTSAFPDGTSVFKKNNVEYDATNLRAGLDTIDSVKQANEIYDTIVKPMGSDFLSAKPPVPVWLVTSDGAPATIKVLYDETPHFQQESQEPYGDGTVPYVSMHVNDEHWGLDEAHKIVIPNTNHFRIIRENAFITAVQRIVTADRA